MMTNFTQSSSVAWLLLVLLAHPVSPQTQPTQNVLEWKLGCTSNQFSELASVTAEQSNRLTGGCGKLTFCNRGNNYEDLQFGYQMESGSCLSPGPVMRMEPGKTYGLILCSVDSVQGDGHPGTNMHTHGPHIPGSGNGDDITRHIYPNSCGFYEYAIPASHMGGTNWYHPHLHFHTEDQASGGAFGLLIIEDRERDYTIDPLQGFISERQDVYDFLTDPDRELLLLAAFDTENEVWVNKNQDNNSLDYNLVVGKWYRMRILTVNPEAEPETIHIPPECDAYALAHDGAYRFHPPKAREQVYYLTGASRIDLAIKCDTTGTYHITNTQGWDDEDIDDDDLGDWGGGSGWYGSPSIAKLNVGGTTPTSGNTGPFLDGSSSTWTSYRPHYLMDLRNAQFDNRFTVDMSDSSVNDLEYNEDCALKDRGNNFNYNTVQQWKHTSADDHPVHVHMYHQQVVTNCGLGHDVGEYYDTVAHANDGEVCKVRFKIIDVGGRVTLHCHILKHEDAGTMGWVNVVGTGFPITPTEPCCLTGICSPCVDENNLPNNCGDDDDDGR